MLCLGAVLPLHVCAPALAQMSADGLRPALDASSDAQYPDYDAATATHPQSSGLPGIIDPAHRQLPDAGSGTQQAALRAAARAASHKPPVDAYAPTGIAIGALRLFPYSESAVGYSSNPAHLPNGTGRTFLRQEVGGTLSATTAIHDFSGTLKAGYTDYPAASALNSPDFNVALRDTINLSHSTGINLDAYAKYDRRRYDQTENAASPALLPSGVYEYGAAAGITEHLGATVLSLRGGADRSTFETVRLADGTSLALEQNNFSQYELRSRAGVEITPEIMPFVEANIDTRVYDHGLDISGYARSSSGERVVLGTSYRITSLINAEIDAGVQHRDYRDARLPDITRPVAEAKLVWDVTPLTKIHLNGSTSIDETSLAGASALIDSRLSGGIEHALLRNLTLTASTSYQFNHYTCQCQDDRIWIGQLGANYALSRELVLKGSYTYTNQTSTNPAARYHDNLFMLALRIQR